MRRLIQTEIFADRYEAGWLFLLVLGCDCAALQEVLISEAGTSVFFCAIRERIRALRNGKVSMIKKLQILNN